MKRKELERVQQMFGVKKKGVLKDRTNNATKRKASTTTKTKKKRKVTFSDQEEERVRVVVRVRPQISEDLEHCLEEDAPINCVRTMSSKKRIAIQRPLYDEKIYGFDEVRVLSSRMQTLSHTSTQLQVLSPSTTQEQTYQVVGKGAVQAVMEGFNGTVLCYGQTGSGKTYTTFGHARFWDKVMENETFASLDENAGILPRAYCDVFQRVNEMRKKGLEVTLRFSALQIYQEQLLDLLHVARTTSSSSGSRPARPDFDNLMTAVRTHDL
jgi:kinesin family member 5